jgi:hypothetical protein
MWKAAFLNRPNKISIRLPLGWHIVTWEKVENFNSPTTLVTVLGKFLQTLFSMRKIGTMVSRLDPKDLADQCFQALRFHWQKYFE